MGRRCARIGQATHCRCEASQLSAAATSSSQAAAPTLAAPAAGLITYDGLPVSSGGGHTLRTRDPRVALQEVEKFIAACAAPVSPLRASVCLLQSAYVPRAFFAPLHERFAQAYGVATLQKLGNDTGHRRQVAREEVPALVALLASLCPLPHHPHGMPPLCVEMELAFHLKAPGSEEALPLQGAAHYLAFVPGYAQVLGESRLYARISAKTSMSLFINFPFLDPTPEFLRCKAHVQQQLPFALSGKHWKRWTLTRKRDGYVGRKLPLPA